MSISDIVSGGSNSAAADVLREQLAQFGNIVTPSAGSLTLPQLQQYVQAGILTPEQAKAFTVSGNAYDSVTADNAGLDSELSTLGELQDIINSGGADAETEATIQGILNTMGTTERGNNEAILRDASARGVGNAGTTLAARLESNQNDATNANSNALNAAATEEAAKLAAMSTAGTLGGNVQGQQYTAGANKANAANAIAEFNANQNQDISKINTATSNAAQAANLSNAQDISNKNTDTAQTQEKSIPAAQQQAFEDALQKATGESGAGENLANQQMQVGQQNAGITGGLLSTAGRIGAAYLTGNPYAALATAMVQNNNSNPNTNVSTDISDKGATGGRVVQGGIEKPIHNMTAGGPVPGKAVMPGDSPRNDTQLAALSPDEIVLPRTVSVPAMHGDTSKVLDFLRSLPKPQMKPAIHPKAVLDTLRGLSMHHQGVA